VPEHADEVIAAQLRRALKYLLDATDSVAVVAGHEPARLGLTAEARTLVGEARLPSVCLHRGKGVLDETDPGFLGLYAGELSAPEVSKVVENAGVLIVLGSFFQGGVVPFTAAIPIQRMVELGTTTTTVAGTSYAVPMRHAIELARETLAGRATRSAPEAAPLNDRAEAADDAPLTQQSAWSLLGEHLRPGQTVSAEAGTSYYALLGARLPADTTIVAQGMWSSIGYTLPAILGAQLADRNRRAVLVIGDGSLQLTAQELGTFERAGAAPIIVVVNNNGYTVERAIHGETAPYNDIATWNWQAVAPTLGASRALTLRAETVGQFRDAIERACRESDRLVFIEALLPELDVPPLLQKVADAVSRRNGYEE
jgi:TPP-dependent 2-oxoacid decarboxylase